MMTTTKPSQKCFVALDNLSKDEVLNLLPKLKGRVCGIKIGLEMYLSHGKEFVLEAKKLFEGQIFLDLKLHDIPNTVAKSIQGLQGLPVDFLTIHAAGGHEMIKAANNATKQALPKATILAVTVLTSLDDNDCDAIFGNDRGQTFERLLKNITSVQGTGLVCSGAELPLIKQSNIVSMVPGIRFEHEISGGQTQDQKSVFTPRQAMENGASFIVVGRSLTKASDLNQALEQLDS